ncbi:metal-dependent hydrolase [Asanoa ishikariensis]|uniref:Amino acid/amide ABC transporter membrane protein 2, HAAT family /amino acid/amide ABC transporter ATP-binding protein 1, HAAT family n=1 Tax=Asanoa ishikariensis TaxID=137265 RepID=A0A1H3T3S3_9ACTN|nr:branched-chain amino acid ABC transporter ATP-binding protein/permease [Asanoa ishikariensis]GIF63038.1 metal-dependent hydrolase [Asanoa ishikariensis]SDZ44872.1 amino acid/amide ABC transporter membrane protein 2, HAAT family /amino acid/amide ABC transporter ATP-binding protein 1, HAAT family [Asanoa ishikariensis]
MRIRLGAIAALAVAAWLLPYQLNSYAMHVVNVMLLYAILSVGLGLCMGIAGQINLAQVAFFGVGAYATAVLTVKEGMGFWTAAVLALLATAAIGLVVGTPALRVQSHYLGIVTLGLALAFTNWVTNSTLAGGAEGIPGIPRPTLPGVDLSSDYLFYYVELALFAVTLVFGLFVVHTSLGRRMRAMRDDSLAAGAVGVEVPALRMTAFLLASVYGGVAGVLYSGLIGYVAPETFSIANMFLLLAMVIIGGRQSLVGCVIGAISLALVREVLIDYPTYAQVAYGTVVVLTVVFAPTGLAGLPVRLRGLLHRRTTATASSGLTPFRPYDPAGTTGEPDAPMLAVRDLSMHFRGVKALTEVSLEVPAGQIRGIVGPNGSGKTTLFNVVSGLYRPTAGRVVLDGRDVTAARPFALAHAGIARTFQNLRLFSALSVRDNVLVALDPTRASGTWRYLVLPVGVWRRDRALRREADALLDRFGLAAFADNLPTALPYGIQRRVEIARAMAARPRLLLLDEPAAGLNGDEVRQLCDIVRSIRDFGVTVVVIEHNMGMVMSLCDHVTVFAHGAIIADGPPAEVAISPEVIEAYLGESMAMPAPVASEVQG